LSRVAQGDHTTGINALAATLAALRLRDMTGAGQTVDVSLQQTGVYTIATDIARTLFDGKQPSRMDRTKALNPLFNTYPTADGQWLMIVHMTPDPYWPSFCRALDMDDFLSDGSLASMQGRMDRAPELCAAIERRFREQPFEYWSERLDSHGLIWAPMAELPDVVADTQLRHRGSFPSVPHNSGSFETVGVPFVIQNADIGVRGPGPGVGADTASVLADAGLGRDEIADLAATGVLG
jgi:crotonobetainyl-CoA:carnitine CoA-transferase CaiB-like acyl-CoA transferase